jgi:hypothetical protein
MPRLADSATQVFDVHFSACDLSPCASKI